MPEPSRYVTIDEAQRRLGCSRRTIYAYITAGKLTTRKTHGGPMRITVASLKRDPRYHEPAVTS